MSWHEWRASVSRSRRWRRPGRRARCVRRLGAGVCPGVGIGLGVRLPAGAAIGPGVGPGAVACVGPRVSPRVGAGPVVLGPGVSAGIGSGARWALSSVLAAIFLAPQLRQRAALPIVPFASDGSANDWGRGSHLNAALPGMAPHPPPILPACRQRSGVLEMMPPHPCARPAKQASMHPPWSAATASPCIAMDRDEGRRQCMAPSTRWLEDLGGFRGIA